MESDITVVNVSFKRLSNPTTQSLEVFNLLDRNLKALCDAGVKNIIRDVPRDCIQYMYV